MTTHVTILGTGGTISAGPTEAGATPQRSAGELASWLAERDGVSVRSRDVFRVPGPEMTPQLAFELAETVRAEVADGAQGVVITQGTDTLEETAYSLALQLDSTVPVVLTGAMRAPHHPGTDGPANLLAAVTAASDPRLAAYGPVVVHQDEVHLARWVTKVHSARVAAFASPQAGPVATVVEGRVELLLGPPARLDRLPVVSAPRARVELLWVVTGSDGFLVDRIADGVDGLVVAGTGAGHTPAVLADALRRVVAAQIPVVLASRCVAPQVLSQTYAGPGSETDLLASGLVSAGSLQPVKARLRLLFALSAGLSAVEVFTDNGGTP